MTIPEALEQLPKFERYALAFSGGADSTALLHALAERLGPEKIVALHFEHGIRGGESLADARFCESFAKSLGVEFALGEAPRGLLLDPAAGNREETARRERYKWLDKTCAELGVGCLLTAHHADDAAETFLMHLFRGSGAAGLVGLRKSVKMKSLFPECSSELLILRPLLEVPGRETREYCLARGLAFREDSTNGDTAYTRNWLRKEIMPLLKERFGEERPLRLRNTSRQLEDTLDLLRAEAEGFLSREALLAAFGVVLAREPFLGLERALRRETLRILAGEEGNWDFKTLEGVLAFLEKGSEPASPPPGAWRWLLLEDKIVFYNESFPLKELLRSRMKAEPAAARGEGYSDGGEGWIRWAKGEKITFAQFARKGELAPASFVPGLRYRPVNGGGKKIGDLFTDAKVPRFLREAVPLLTLGEAVAFLPGWRISQEAALGEGDEVLRLSLELPGARPWTRELFNALKRGEAEW